MTLAAIIVLAAWSAGCRRDGNSRVSDMEDPPLVSVGDTVLTMRDVVSRIPPGMTGSDSAALFHAIVDGWLERMLVVEIARDNIDDLDEIDRQVEEYRKKLIVEAYRRKLREAGDFEVSEKDIRTYFSGRKDEMILERPVVKGIYVKLPSDASTLPDVRRWMKTATSDALDNIEQYGLTDATQYSFFSDRWTDFSVLATEIPYRFGDMDRFVATTSDFETTYGGMTYLLHISEYLSSGSPMPYEVAAPLISERLLRERGARYEERLLREIYSRARREGRLRYHTYTPGLPSSGGNGL